MAKKGKKNKKQKKAEKKAKKQAKKAAQKAKATKATRAKSAPAPKPAQRKPAARAVRQRSTRAAAPAPNPVRALAQRIVDLTIAQNDEASLALYADDVVSTEMGMPPVMGLAGIKQKLAMWHGMVSDSTWEARNVYVDGNTIIIEWAGRVTFASTGKQAPFDEIAIHEIVNGKIARERFYYDRSVLQP
ncbi:MAG TPA: nuclear transport factor 2 family protein [Candidatus Binatia bacterium]|nr:nuclear transport factor 2 family protein [Candidatus Binatia bacterium]